MCALATGARGGEDRAIKPRVYIDTDMAAEVDDSFAVFRALVAPEFHVVSLSSIGWDDQSGFAANTHKSQRMNEDVLALLHLTDRVSHPIGALHPMPSASEPVDSPAARDIIAKAKETPNGQKLQVFVLGAYTNVASALRLDPSVRDKLTVNLMGFIYDGGRLTTNESNCEGYFHAAAYLLESGVDLNVMAASSLRTFRWSRADADAHFQGRGGVPDYLLKRWTAYAPEETSHVMWDIAVFEAFLSPKLATLSKAVHNDRKLHIWTKVDVKAMQADYWDATKPQ